MLMLTAWITEATDWGLRIDNFGVACWAGIIIAIVSLVLSVLVPGNGRVEYTSSSREITY